MKTTARSSSTNAHVNAATRIFDGVVGDATRVGEGGMAFIEDLGAGIDLLGNGQVHAKFIRSCAIDGRRCHAVAPDELKRELRCKVVKRAKVGKTLRTELDATREVLDAMAASGYAAHDLTAIPSPPQYLHVVMGDHAAIPMIPMHHMAGDALAYLQSIAHTREFTPALLRCVATFLLFCDVIHAAKIIHGDAKLENMLVRVYRGECAVDRRAFISEFVAIDFDGSSYTADVESPVLGGDNATCKEVWRLVFDSDIPYMRMRSIGRHRHASPRAGDRPEGYIDFHAMGASIAFMILDTKLTVPRIEDIKSVARILLQGFDDAAGKMRRLRGAFPRVAATNMFVPFERHLVRAFRAREAATKRGTRQSLPPRRSPTSRLP